MLIDSTTLKEPIKPKAGSTLNNMRKAELIKEDADDVAPVVHGRWIEQEKYNFGVMYDCSICGDRILDNGHPWNYCPNCGCRMDGGDDE